MTRKKNPPPESSGTGAHVDAASLLTEKSRATGRHSDGSRDTTPPEPGGEPGAKKACLVVAIGASAGGLDPLEQLFIALPPDCGISFVVIMHLPPDAPSYLPGILHRYTTMEVMTAEEGMPLLPDTVYVIPAGRDMTIGGGLLCIEEPVAHRTVHPIDRFFRSLAAEAGERAVALVLSGFGMDGSEGVKAVREAGGIVIVQEPGSALNPAMPRSAITTGAADFIIPAEEIPGKIVEIARGTCALGPRACRTATHDEELRTIFDIVKARTGHDFSSYKANTVMRRIERRLAVNEVAGIMKYVAILNENSQEAHALAQDILIGVTGFFRDPDAFEVARREVIPRLFANRGPDDPVRIWHACCATGEEVYSMAILIREYLDSERIDATVQLFATDIDEAAIAQARAGIYPDDIVAEVGEERLKAFFTMSNGRWQVIKRVREMIVFAHHSLIKNPPFSRLDLLVCRNFLIYLNPDMQKRLIALFHQVLKPGGYLFLGSSETVGRHSDLFTPLDKKWKVFQRLESGRRADALFPFTTPIRYFPGTGRSIRPAEAFEPSPGAVAEKLLMERYSPPCVVVNEKYEVVYVSARTSRYLQVPVGEPTRDILRMAREELRPALRAAIYKAFTEQKEVAFRGVKVDIDGGEAQVNVLVEPVTAPPPAERLAMVVFEPALPPAVCPAPGGSGEAPAGDESTREMLVRQLEEQLRVTHEQLQAVTEQLETSNEGFLSANEELISMNEEFQSGNEELQSTNEELETSKEELQALNEELITVNAELQGKVEELNQVNSDMENLLTSSEIATLFLDRHFAIKRFTPVMAAIFNLIPADIGRPFRHLAGTIDWPGLSRDAETVLENLVPIEREVTALENRRYYLMRVLPYRSTNGVIDGIIVTLVDITEHKKAEEALRESEKRYHSLFENMMEGFAYCKMLYDDQGSPVDFVYLDVNNAFGRLTGLENVKGRKVTEVIPGIRESSQDLFEIYSRVASTGQPEKFEIEFKPLSAWFSISVYSMEREYFVAVFDDITERKRAENVVQARLRMLAAAHISLDEMLQMALDEIEAQTGSVIGFYHFLGSDQETLSLQAWSTNTLRSMCSAEGKGNHYPVSQAGVWADCVHERRPVIHNDYATLPGQKGMPPGHAPVVREMLIPILRGERIVAIIGVGNKPTDYNATDVEIASLLGDVSWEIVERKRMEEEQETTVEFLRFANESRGTKELLHAATTFFQKRSGCEAVGIRVKEGNDYPYYETRGFPEEFILAENRLCACDEAGRPISDSDGNPVIDCMCGNVICGRFDQAKSFFTAKGSFWTNSTTELLASTSETDRQARTRNRCNGEGYESVALIPLRLGEERLGLLQLNDRQKGLFSPEAIALWERLADQLAVALAKFLADKALRESEEQFRTLTDSIPNLAWWANADGYITWYNQRWYEYTGTTPDQMEGWGWQSVHDSKVLPKVLERWKASIATGQPFDMEFPLRGADGEFRSFLTRVLPLKDSAGQVLRWFGTNTDISALKQTQEALRESKERVRLKLDSILSPEGDIGILELADIIDAPAMQSLMENFYKLTRMPMGMIDLKGKVLVGVGWQDVCTRFHRIHPETCNNCVESDTLLSAGVPPGEFKLYKCKNNMWDAATPIMVGGRQFGNFFMGQFFFEDESLDYEFFRSQARQYGFDEKEYIAALESAPRLSRESLATGMAYFMELADMISRTSYSNLKLARSMAERDTLMDSLQKAHDELEQRVEERTEELASTINFLKEEIAERERAEEKILRLNRLHAVLSETDQAIVRAADRDTLFHDFCRIAVENGGFLLSWIGLVDEETGQVKMAASAGATGYLADIRISAREEPEGLGPTGISVREGTYYICNDFLGDPCTRLWHETGRAHGIGASAAIALKLHGKAIGALTLYADTKDFFDQQHVELLLQMGAEISFALDNLEREALRREAEQALQMETSKRLQAVEELRVREQLLMQQSRQAAMGEMIGNIAHQWRQPLNLLGLIIQELPMNFELDALTRENLDASVSKATQVIHHMSQTIDDFRNFFRPDKVKVLFKANDIVAKTVSLIEGSFREQRIKIEISARDDIFVYGYPNEYSQVILNILINARDAFIERRTDDPKAVIITLSREYDKAVATIADNAGGIAAEIMEKIFDPYFTTKGPDKGTGVGLFMSKTIIEKNMNGRLSARNSGNGAEFRIEV